MNNNFLCKIFVLSVVLGLSSCGGGGSVPGKDSSGNTVVSNQTTSSQPAPTLTASASMAGLSVAPDSVVSIQLRDANGVPIKNTVVSFEDPSGLLIFPKNSGNNSSMTDADGIANITISPKSVNTVGAGKLTAKATVGTSTIEGSISYKLTAASSTGLPDQDSFTISADLLNIEGYEFNDAESTIEVNLGDHDNRKVNGVTVKFLTSGGTIPDSCVTEDGKCSVKLKSISPKPLNGVVTVLAYAIGEETFVDANSNNVADIGEFEDLGEPFANAPGTQNAVFDQGDFLIDTNGNGKYDGPDSKFVGSLCDETKVNGSKPGTCAPAGTKFHVRKSIDIIFSKSTAAQGVVLNINGSPNLNQITLKDQSDAASEKGCTANQEIILELIDDNRNPMAAGTKITLATNNGELSVKEFKVPSSNVSTDSTRFRFNLSSDGARQRQDVTSAKTVCVDTTGTGTLTIVVTTPRGIKVFEKSIIVLN